MVKGGIGYIVLTKEGYSVEHKVFACVGDFGGEKLKSMEMLKKFSQIMVKGGVGYILLTKEGYSVEHKVCALVDDFRGEKLKSMEC